MSTALRSLPSGTPYLADILQPERNTFGLLRLMAALAVVVSHSVHLAGGPESAEPLVALTGFSLGQHAVHAFFSISGVLIAASLMRSETLGVFVRARALRLLPGLAVCILLSALVIGPLLSQLSLRQYFHDVALYQYIALTLGLVSANAPLPGVFAHNPVPDIVNLPLWTLKYETLCYLGLAALGFFGLMRSPRLASAVLVPVLLAGVAAAAFPQVLHGSATIESFLRLSFSFGLGTLAYVWRDRLPLHWWGVALAFFAMALLIRTRLEGPADQIFIAYATLWAASLSAGWLGSLTRKNDLSYGVYIYDWFIAQALMQLMPGLSQPELLALTLALLVPTATLSWFLIEKPTLSWKRSRKDNSKEAGERFRLALRLEPPAPSPVAIDSTANVEMVPVFPLEGPARERFSRIAGMGRVSPPAMALSALVANAVETDPALADPTSTIGRAMAA